jgi:hypothetical protein
MGGVVLPAHGHDNGIQKEVNTEKSPSFGKGGFLLDFDFWLKW